MKRRWIEAATILMTAGVIGLTGCGMNSIGNQGQLSSLGGGSPVTAATSPHGEAFGGQQPVSGMSLQLYAAGSSGYGSAATGLFAAPTLTTATGGFSFPTYACPTPTT